MTQFENEETRGMASSVRGTANELRLLAELLDRGYNASKVDLPHSKYDILVQLRNTGDSASNPAFIRIQVKTIGPSRSISFVGGVRGGKDRTYKSDVKQYTQNTETSDLVVGVESKERAEGRELNYYLVPTLVIEALDQKSITIKKLGNGARNNWELLGKCRDRDYVSTQFRNLTLVTSSDTSPSNLDLVEG